jgi:peptide/nickel transport system substrate-binding protein
MKDQHEKDHGNYLGVGVDRRTFLKIAGVTGGLMAAPGLGLNELFAATPEIQTEDPYYTEKFYKARKGWYMNDPRWVKKVTPRLTWPKAGERVPEIEVLIPSRSTTWIDSMRKWTADAPQLGLKYRTKTISSARWLELINKHYHGDIELHPAVMRPERVDASEWLTSRAYGTDRRNYGEYVCKEYDKYVRLQAAESDFKKRLKYVQEAQRIMAEDLYVQLFGWGPSIIEAYNSQDWEGIVPARGFGISNSNLFHTFLNLNAKSSRNELRVGVLTLIKTSNIFFSGNRFRAIGRMVYDRLAYLDQDLNVIPWAAESWEKLDNQTWDLKLRDGMTFHDGKPVTVDDLKFTMDFMLKYERGKIWSANRFCESVEIKDRAKRILRFRFKQPYGQFETYFLLMNIILPKHIFEGILARQKVGDDPRKLKIPKPLGSGPFKWGKYVKDTELQLIANKDHFSAPKIDKMTYVVVPSIDGLLGRLQTKEIDMVEQVALTPSQAKQLEKFKHLSIERTPDVNWFHGVCMISRLPWRDHEFRRAWHHSIDRKFLVQAVWEGEGRIPKSNTFFVEGSPWHNPNLPTIPEFDMKLARKILKDAGYSWDSQGRLVYPPPTDKKFVERVNRVCVHDAWGGLKMLPRT